ncbi:TPA: 2,3-bisphosphoglycerate-independent phosphoglycerate mutase [Candidatus Micrarchaeota archaeon]|nr:2,3-bisphosphoglycerate-independent phosphoglycerate mutase [Candidatus Micrarchaeota archaeon]
MTLKKLLVVLDGVGDLPCKALKGKTPLEAAAKQNLDFLASRATTGCINIAGEVAPESDVGVFSVLGFDPKKQHFGRGALEAIGSGLGFQNGWLAVRVNFATSDASGVKLLDRRVGRNLSTVESKLLAQDINENIHLQDGTPFEFNATVGHRAAVVFKGKGFSKHISNTDPAYVVKGGIAHAQKAFEMRVRNCVPLEETREAQKTAEIINEFTSRAHEVLEESKTNKKRVAEGKLPGNAILLRDAETQLNRPQNPWGRERWALLADMPLEVGIAKFLGMDVIELPTPHFDKRDYQVRAEKTKEALGNYDGVYVHLKGPDLYGHDGDAKGKKKSIEEIDEFYFGPLLKKISLEKVRIAVTGDHSTPCELKSHSADSVPYLVTTNKFTCGHFEEGFCREKKPIPAQKLMGILLKRKCFYQNSMQIS